MLDELRHLLLVAQHGTFTAAAKHAHLSQPALSASIRRLEEHVGARLLERGRSGAALTVAGRALQPRAEAALAAFADGERAVREVVGLQIGEVRVGAGATASTYLLPPTLRDFRERHPGVRLMLREAFTSRLLSDLRAGELDLAIVTGPGDDPWICDELVLVAAPGLDAKRAGYITFAEGSPTRAALVERFGEARIVMELGSIAAVKANVRAGVGVALLSRVAVAKDVRSRTMRIVRSADTPIRRQLSLVHRGLERMPPAAARLRQLLLGEAPRGACALTPKPRRPGRVTRDGRSRRG